MQIKKLVSLPSRTGRHNQRYNIQGCRQVVGCIPYRFRKDKESLSLIEDGEIEVLLISSQKSPRLMFPKGGWETDEDMKAAALRETFEEAGVDGVVEDYLGQWSFKSKSQGTIHEGHMLALRVTEELDIWPEQHVRQRIWVTVSEAREQCFHAWMKEALDNFCQIIQSARKEQKPQTNCRLEFLTSDGPTIGILAQSGEDEVDCPTNCRVEIWLTQGPRASIVTQNGEEEVECCLVS